MLDRPAFPGHITDTTMRISTILAAIALTTLLAACNEEGEGEGEEDAIEQSADGEDGEDEDED